MRMTAGACFAALFGLAACGQTPSSDGSSLGGESRMHVGDAAAAAGDQDLATSMYAQASAASPRDAAIQLRYADALVRKGKIGQARDLLIKHLPLVSEPQELRRGLGSLYLLAGQPSSALAELDTVLATQPRDMKAIVDKAVALDLLQRHREAQLLYRTALAESPDDPIVKNDLALSYMMEGRTREARDLLMPVRDSGGMSPRIAVNLGVLVAANGDLNGGRAIVGNLLSEDQLVQLSKAATESNPRPSQ